MSQAASQAAAFYKDVAENRRVWTLRDENGYPAPENPEGVRALPFWSSSSRAERIVANVPAYEGFEVVEFSLERFINEWLPGLASDGMRVGVNWSGPRAVGYDIDPSQLQATIESAVRNKT